MEQLLQPRCVRILVEYCAHTALRWTCLDLYQINIHWIFLFILVKLCALETYFFFFQDQSAYNHHYHRSHHSYRQFFFKMNKRVDVSGTKMLSSFIYNVDGKSQFD